jgi:uroporphyrinogen-III synthase
MNRLLITRPINQSLKTADKLTKLGYNVKISPLLKIEPIKLSVDYSNYELSLVTSWNAATLLKKYTDIVPKKAIVVGDKSATELKAMGIEVMASAENMKRLITLIGKEMQLPKEIVCFSGDYISLDTDIFLRNKAFKINRVNLYRSIINDRFDVEALCDIDTILIYSERSAQAFHRICSNTDLSKTKIICISKKVSDHLKNFGIGSLLTSKNPTEDSMIELC